MADTTPEASDPGPTTRALFDRGLQALEAGDTAGALALLRGAHEANPNDARVRSHYGLCVGLVERRFEDSVELCQSAAKQDFFNPELYLNLATLYLAFGFKPEGIRFLRRGLMIDPGSAEIARVLHELGDRTSPVLNFLPRRHPVNRWLGAVRHLVSRTAPRSVAA